MHGKWLHSAKNDRHSISVPSQDIFQFLSVVENMSKFGRNLNFDLEKHKLLTMQGEMVTFRENNILVPQPHFI